MIFVYFRSYSLFRFDWNNSIMPLNTVYKMRHILCCTIIFALCANMFGYAVSDYIVKKWSKASVRSYLTRYTPKVTFTFHIKDQKVLGNPTANLIEDHEIMIGSDMYDIISSHEGSGGIKTVLCILDKEEMSLRDVCYKVFHNAPEKSLPFKSRHTSLMKTVIKDGQLPIYTFVFSHIISFVQYAEVTANMLSIKPPIFSPPPELYS